MKAKTHIDSLIEKAAYAPDPDKAVAYSTAAAQCAAAVATLAAMSIQLS